MKKNYDVIVIGLGIMGASALWRVSSKCDRVLGLDASGPTHSSGSSHGASRIFRRAYWEGDKYLPLLKHADLLWNELEQLNKRRFLFKTGGIFIGQQSSRVVAGSIRTAKKGNIEHEIWTGATIKDNFPAFSFKDRMRAVFEPGAYAIAACDARLEMLNEAIYCGATAEFGDSVVAIENCGAGIRVSTQSGRTYFAKAVIVTTGPWISEHLSADLEGCLKPCQVPVYWFKPKKGSETLFSLDRFPVFLYEYPDGALLYGVPSIISSEPGVKIGFHNRQQMPATPDWRTTSVNRTHLEEISRTIESIFSDLESSPIGAKNCFYTMSLDESFLIGKSQTMGSVYFASACSGHGFKFAPAIGDALANMAVGQQPHVPLLSFSADRFGRSLNRF